MTILTFDQDGDVRTYFLVKITDLLLNVASGLLEDVQDSYDKETHLPLNIMFGLIEAVQLSHDQGKYICANLEFQNWHY